MIKQMALYDIIGTAENTSSKNNYIVDIFSANHLCSEEARQKLEKKYESILEVTKKFDRKSVSYQIGRAHV